MPDNLHRELKQRAKRHHRSLNKEVIALIEAALHNREADALTEADDGRQHRTACVMALRPGIDG